MFFYRLYQKIKVIKRFNAILLALFRAGFSALIYRSGMHRHVPVAHRLDNYGKKIEDDVLPKKLKSTLEALGPVFVKFGQILSTRTDILPKPYIEELEKLQYAVKPFPFFKAKIILEQSLDRSIESAFEYFNEIPFASASLGQVYEAKLKTGEKVAVKVQRPNAKEQIKVDMQVLQVFASLAEKYVPGAKERNLLGIVKEFQRWTINELDYRKEATNGEIFFNFFKNDPNVYSPKVYWDYSSDSVLTLEFIDGVQLGDIVAKRTRKKFNSKIIAHRLADSFIRQYFDYGFFHADPHPGNIMVLKDNKLMFLDFGMVGYLDGQLTALAAGAFLAILQRDVEKIVSILVQVAQNYDERAQSRDVRDFVNINGMRKQINQIVLQWASVGKAGQFTRLFKDIVDSAIMNGVAVPVDLTLFSKSILTLDAVAHDLDPDLKIEEWEKPLVDKIVLGKFKAEAIKERAQNAALSFNELLAKLPDSTAAVINNLERGRFGMELNTDQLLQYEKLLNANSNFSTYGTFLAALVIALALVYQSGTHPIFWKFTLPGWGLYAGIGIIVWIFWRTRRTRAG